MPSEKHRLRSEYITTFINYSWSFLNIILTHWQYFINLPSGLTGLKIFDKIVQIRSKFILYFHEVLKNISKFDWCYLNT